MSFAIHERVLHLPLSWWSIPSTASNRERQSPGGQFFTHRRRSSTNSVLLVRMCGVYPGKQLKCLNFRLQAIRPTEDCHSGCSRLGRSLWRVNIPEADPPRNFLCSQKPPRNWTDPSKLDASKMPPTANCARIKAPLLRATYAAKPSD